MKEIVAKIEVFSKSIDENNILSDKDIKTSIIENSIDIINDLTTYIFQLEQEVNSLEKVLEFERTKTYQLEKSWTVKNN